jgi:hypothetical protein
VSKRLNLDDAFYARLHALATTHACTIETLLVEAVELGEMLTEASRIEFIHPEHTGGTVRIYHPWHGFGGLHEGGTPTPRADKEP